MRAAAVVRASGIQTEWTVGRESDQRALDARFTVIVMAEAPARLHSWRGADVLGQAVPSLGRAYVYFDRISRRVSTHRTIGDILGDVIAHELGHLLLDGGHAPAGIMRPAIQFASNAVETFTTDQRVAIERTLETVTDR